MHRSTPPPEVQEKYRMEAAGRVEYQLRFPQPLGKWAHINPRYFALTESWHSIGDLIIHSVFNRTPEEERLQIEEIPIQRHFNDEGREWFPAPTPTKDEIRQAQLEAVIQRIEIDDRQRLVIQEISRLRNLLVPMLRRMTEYGMVNMINWDQERRAQYHINRRNLQEHIINLRMEIDELHHELPVGYAEQFIPIPLEVVNPCQDLGRGV